VTLVGAGGIGKTTATAAVGRAQLASLEGAVWFVDLGMLNDAALVAAALEAALGLPVQSQNPAPALIAYLHDKRILLVLDGCEHMIDTVAQLAEQIIRQTPACAFSRRVARPSASRASRSTTSSRSPAHRLATN
jgi:predicted ATPase